jgi:hypothetical protein
MGWQWALKGNPNLHFQDATTNGASEPSSDADTAQIMESATDDAKTFFLTHNTLAADKAALNTGLAHGLKNGYKGQAAYLYADFFYTTFDALYKDQ